ncbi:MAG: acetyl ornithine aminotransferase family protein [Aureliella sp.]
MNKPIDDGNAHWLARFRESVPAACLRSYDPKHTIVIQRGKGSRVWDVEGNEYLDFTCGYSTSNLGHGHERLLKVATEQLASVAHLTGQPHKTQIQLAERLIRLLADLDQQNGMPSIKRKVVFNSTGARAVETAWQAAVAHRPGQLLSISPSFHGNTIALAPHSTIEQDAQRQSYRRPIYEYPYCSRCPLGLYFPGCNIQCAEGLFKFIERNARSISAILVEPMLGARGYILPPQDYFQRLSELAARYGILTIADEVQTALGRCGNWTLSHSQGWQADILVVGKSLGGGIAPISAVVGRAEALECLSQGQSSETFAATPVACAVAMAVLDELEQHDHISSAREIGQQMRDFVSQQLTEAGISEVVVEGIGASCCIEFLGDSLDNSIESAKAFAVSCQTVGLLVHLSGPARTRVVLLPPLNLTADELSDAKERITLAIGLATA